MKPKLVQKEPHRVYEVKLQPFDWNDFTEWLWNLKETDFSVSVNGNMFRFRDKYDKEYFVMGFGFAWDCFTDANMYAKKRMKR